MIRLHELAIAFPGAGGGLEPVVRGVSLELGEGERLGLVGESGSGKSLTALACLGLVPEPGRLVGGRVEVDGLDLAAAPAARLRALRGGEIGLVFQEAAGALNPVYTVGFQLVETIRCHRSSPRLSARQLALDLLAEVALDEPQAVSRAYPHELSGGQAQRVMLALALAGAPHFLIADEPTSELDPITRAEILALIDRLCGEHGLGLLLISHDLASVRGAVERLAVMYAGRIVEEGPAAEVFGAPMHPFTRELLAAVPGRRAPGLKPGLPPAAARAGRESDAGPRAQPQAAPARPAGRGCPYQPRCSIARAECRETAPELIEIAPGRRLRCPVAAAGGAEAET
jgi:oligopeptide/dipeptide ABC transporter ATP-binding protein